MFENWKRRYGMICDMMCVCVCVCVCVCDVCVICDAVICVCVLLSFIELCPVDGIVLSMVVRNLAVSEFSKFKRACSVSEIYSYLDMYSCHVHLLVNNTCTCTIEPLYCGHHWDRPKCPD